MDSARKAALTAGRDMWSTVADADAGIPSVKMADGPMGIASGRVDERDVSVLTPSGVALGATWDVDLVARVGALVGGEAKRLGVDMILAPNLNLPRSPLAGRAFEMYSEDPLLAGALGCAWIGGVQSRRVGAVAKHLVCNDSETQRDRYDAVIDEPALREVYLLPFEMAVEAGCAGLLTAYNKVNGDYCAENHQLLTEVVKGDWSFEGFTVSDWFGTHSTVGSAGAGLDLEMPGPARIYGPKLGAAVEQGAAPQAALDDAAERVGAAARRWAGAGPQTADEDRTALLTEAAAAGFTLLRNEGDLLPLDPGQDRTIAVIGPNAAAPCFQGGTFAKIALRPDASTPVDAIRARFAGRAKIVFEPGVDPQPRLPSMPATPARDLGDGCSRGLTVDYFAGHDLDAAPVASETRDTNSLTWFTGMHNLVVLDRPAGVRASGWFTPERSGAHSFHIGGTGSVRLMVDGKVVLDHARSVPANDIMGVLKGGDSESAQVMLAAGRPVLVQAELRFHPARAQGLWYGVRGPDDAAAMLARAVEAARTADAVVLVVGETADAGVESRDRTSTQLAADQLELIDQICAVNRRVAVVVNVGHAFDASWADKACALMVAWYPGEAFGEALAQVLAGDREPGGRLPVSLAAADADYPVFDLTPDDEGRLAYVEGSRPGYRGMADRGARPLFALGEGLGYGRFHYEAAVASRTAEGGACVSVTVHNAGDHDCAEVVQLYALDPFLLTGFAKVQIPAGERRQVEVAVNAKVLRRWTIHGWRAAKGAVRIGVGRSAGDIRKIVDIELD